MRPLLLLLLSAGAACSPAAPDAEPPPETDRPWSGEAEYALDGLPLRAQGDRLLAGTRGSEVVVGTGLVGPPAVAPGRLVAALDDGRSTGRIVAFAPNGRGGVKATPLVEAGGRPDRISLSPDGATVAFVWGITGIAGVWTVPAAGDTPPSQLTNIGLEDAPRRPGEAPEGFVPPPDAGPPRFEGDDLVWTAQGREWTVRWRHRAP